MCLHLCVCVYVCVDVGRWIFHTTVHHIALHYITCAWRYALYRWVYVHSTTICMYSHLYVSMCKSVSIHEVMCVCTYVLAAECSGEQQRQQQQYHKPFCKRKASLYWHVLHCIVSHCIVLYCTVLYCIVLYCIVLYCIVWQLADYSVQW